MARLKRYLVFSYAHYYPAGGWDDFISSHESKQEAKDKAREAYEKSCTVEVVDTWKGKAIWWIGNNGEGEDTE
jgi:hypothetical protein